MERKGISFDAQVSRHLTNITDGPRRETGSPMTRSAGLVVIIFEEARHRAFVIAFSVGVEEVKSIETFQAKERIVRGAS